MKDISVYIHIPFCRTRCGYCDFNTYSGKEELIPEYTKSLCKELLFSRMTCSEPFQIQTIYFGGGTPSLLPIKELAAIIDTIYENFQIKPDCEITLEANPGSLTFDQLQELRQKGINRLSVGAQSFSEKDLELLNRKHTVRDLKSAMLYAQMAGFNNINLDLIYGIPGQTMPHWENSLESAINLSPEHLSLYPLTIEQGTPMYCWVKEGLIHPLDEDTVADMYEIASQVLERNGYTQYEISNWVVRKEPPVDYRCRHNLQYWRNLEYLGFGAGAHGYANQIRTINEPIPEEYINLMHCREGKGFNLTPATSEFSIIDKETEIGETMMLGLRLVQDGISSREFQKRFQIQLEDVYLEQINLLVKQGLLEWHTRSDRRLRLTERGRLLGNKVFMAFI